MYIPKHFEQTDLKVLQDLVRAAPLATLVTVHPHGLNANPIPLYFELNEGLGVLQGHIARANSLWRDFDKSVEALAIFQGADAYISPSWYPSKQEHGKVVPTWNYIAMHVYGNLRMIDDATWLQQFLEKLTAQEEADFPQPWKLSDAPASYIENMLKAIIGIELEITRWEGKYKLSQNKTDSEYQGIIDGLQAQSSAAALVLAKQMNALK